MVVCVTTQQESFTLETTNLSKYIARLLFFLFSPKAKKESPEAFAQAMAKGDRLFFCFF